MQFTLASLLTAMALVATSNGLAVDKRQNDGRPVVSDVCCAANQSLKEDVCFVNGVEGKCVPANTANCGAQLTCVANDQLECSSTETENGRPVCRIPF
ncbi:hypothetical protein F4780DRAFT_116702 [Xylariomycetidae sp. FL0641]|nr:hypothetical protein F4780DRAFT_116702 [Xylariomycetidae sp. FL0641]